METVALGECSVGRIHNLFVEAMRGPSSDAGRFLRTLLGALEAEVEFIPPICLACRQPCYSECPRCTAHWCDECRGDLEFCPMCGSSDEELSGDDADGAGSVWWQRDCQLQATAAAQHSLQCHHVHSDQEWTPVQVDGVTICPSAHKAEYSASLVFAIAISVSWWAARTGYAVMAIPRLPPDECVGRQVHWLDFDPRSMRQWAIARLAVSLGLPPPHPAEAARVPTRRRVEDSLVNGQLPENCIYVGQSHHSHRRRRTKWASPFTPRHDVSLDEWLPCYLQWIMENHYRGVTPQ